eukprot:TRINITY_DN21771_c0_g1_i5.p1 TRINITY_DN21771_c0_g1~~TRINITY_DN21771_c0_g1_i5.p1  ORF type:complete len:343 (+),score=84.03 TRINITY_DN21771_c0_g1_i5:92-1030(+)
MERKVFFRVYLPGDTSTVIAFSSERPITCAELLSRVVERRDIPPSITKYYSIVLQCETHEILLSESSAIINVLASYDKAPPDDSRSFGISGERPPFLGLKMTEKVPVEDLAEDTTAFVFNEACWDFLEMDYIRTEEKALHLAALKLLCDVGPYRPETSHAGFLRREVRHFLPKLLRGLRTLSEWEEDIIQAYKEQSANIQSSETDTSPPKKAMFQACFLRQLMEWTSWPLRSEAVTGHHVLHSPAEITDYANHMEWKAEIGLEMRKKWVPSFPSSIDGVDFVASSFRGGNWSSRPPFACRDHRLCKPHGMES